MPNTPVFILGAGGHSKVLIDCLLEQHPINILGILDVNEQLVGKHILGVRILGSEDQILQQYSPSEVQLVNGLGSVGSTTLREKIFTKFKRAGYPFLSIKHPSAYLARSVALGEGTQLMARSTIQPDCQIGDNVIVNTHASIDHDCIIGDHVHLAPGVTCCGSVTIGRGTHVGCGAVILQGVTIEEHCLIAAGAVVVNNVISGSKMLGVPAKITERL